jgi:hypothetical protein
MGILSGNVTFINSVNYLSSGDIYGSGIFCGSSINANSIATGYFFNQSVNSGNLFTGTFYNTSINSGNILSNALFLDTSINKGIVSGFASFAQTASNVGGTAIGGSGLYGVSNQNNLISATKIGSSIENLDEVLSKSFFGSNVSINGDATVVAISDGDPTSSYIYTFCWNGSSWTRIGVGGLTSISLNSPINGNPSYLNDAGTKLAVGYTRSVDSRGRVRVFSWSGSDWTDVGDPIIGLQDYEGSSYSISMNDSSNRIVITSPSLDNLDNGELLGVGGAGIYSWNGVAWTQMGSTIYGDEASDSLGVSVSMNYQGDRFVISDNNGIIKVYSWNGSDWVQMGSNISGEPTEQAGRSLKINGAGDQIIVGCPTYSEVVESIGRVKIYSWNGSDWIMSAQIKGSLKKENFGWSVSSNRLGNKIVVGAPRTTEFLESNGQPSLNPGSVKVYSYANSNWSQSVATISGEVISNSLNMFGSSVCMNSNGTHIIVGEPGWTLPQKRFSGSPDGRVSIYYIN